MYKRKSDIVVCDGKKSGVCRGLIKCRALSREKWGLAMMLTSPPGGSNNSSNAGLGHIVLHVPPADEPLQNHGSVITFVNAGWGPVVILMGFLERLAHFEAAASLQPRVLVQQRKREVLCNRELPRTGRTTTTSKRRLWRRWRWRRRRCRRTWRCGTGSSSFFTHHFIESYAKKQSIAVFISDMVV